MEEIIGRVNLVYENIESKSEGVTPYLLVDKGEEGVVAFRLYRANVFNVNDDFFSSYDSKYVAVSGKIEMESWINVSSVRELEEESVIEDENSIVEDIISDKEDVQRENNDIITTNDNNYEQL